MPRKADFASCGRPAGVRYRMPAGILRLYTVNIHNKLIEKAKEKLSITALSVSEIAYALGFEHPQSFSKFFRNKTNQRPLAFRASFN